MLDGQLYGEVVWSFAIFDGQIHDMKIIHGCVMKVYGMKEKRVV
jgi:hypothetical protein